MDYAKESISISRTKDGELMVFIPSISALLILDANYLPFHCVGGDLAEFIFKKLTCTKIITKTLLDKNSLKYMIKIINSIDEKMNNSLNSFIEGHDRLETWVSEFIDELCVSNKE